MTTWTDVGDMPVEMDEYDPTAPFIDRDDPRTVSIETDLEGNPLDAEDTSQSIFLPDGTPHWDRGFGDGNNVVRVWATPEGDIHKVRVSPNWRERVGGKGKSAEVQAAGLAGSFTASFGFINILVQKPEESTAPKVTADGPGPRPLTWADLNRVNRELDEVREQLRAIPAGQGHGRWSGSEVVGHGAGGKVAVRLNERGGYSSIQFAPEWLADSNVGMICNAVPEAARNARDKFVPPVYEPGERDLLNNRTAELRQELSAMMQRGFVR